MIATRTIVAVFAVLGLAAGSSLAQGRGGAPHGASGYHGGGYHGGGHPSGGWNHGGHYYGGHYHGGYAYPYWGWGLGVGVGIGYASAYWGWPYYYGYGGPYYGYAWPYYGPYYTDGYYGRPNAYETPPASSGSGSTTASAAPATPPPEPIYYPRNGQSDAQKETDLRDCNRWATTQPPAMADASVFQRAVLACMDGRGYTAR